jgi:hypothetical protein
MIRGYHCQRQAKRLFTTAVWSRCNRATTYVGHQAGMRAAVLWAEESELCEDGLIRVIVEREQRRFPGRVTGASVPHERHAMTNDIYLNAALVMQGLHDIDALSGGTGKP